MNDDLGRGLLGWTDETWKALDALAADTVTEHVVLRNLIEHKESPDAHSARIAGADYPVEPISHEFTISMGDDEEEDVQRKVRNAAESLAIEEDKIVLNKLKKGVEEDQKKEDADKGYVRHITKAADISELYTTFVAAKHKLKSAGISVVVSSDMLIKLESGIVGMQPAIDVAERVLGTKILQSSALGGGEGNPEAVIFLASPPAYRMVRAWGPRLRVVKVEKQKVTLEIEEAIAVGRLEAGKCVVFT